MDLIQAFRLGQPDSAPKVAFVGAGGKTSAMFQCARCFSGSVIVTASAHLDVNQISLADHHFFEDQITDLENHIPFGVILVTGAVEEDSGRTLGLSPSNLNRLYSLAEKYKIPMLIEADGSRRLPLKAPANHEPPIPDFVDTVIVVAGLSGLGQPLSNEVVHRPEIFASLAQIKTNAQISSKALTEVLKHPMGGLKHIPAGARRLVLLNQADTAVLQAQSAEMAPDLLGVFEAVISSSLQPLTPDSPPQIHAVHERIAAVILAAGESRRLGRPKQLLDWHGQPLIWHVASHAVQAGLSPVIVVCGELRDQIGKALSDLPVIIIDNPDWQLGQGTTVRVGTEAVPASNKGILFLLADQPQIPVTLLRALVAEHAQSLDPIIAPLVDGQRANPVLFDQVTFPDLRMLSGDTGGRKLFSKYPPHWLPWHDPAPLMDVDTIADYQKLLEIEP